MGEMVLFHDVNVAASGFARSQINKSHPSDSEEKNTIRDGVSQGCIFRLTCSHPELTEDHVLTSAYVKFFRTVTRNAVNKSV